MAACDSDSGGSGDGGGNGDRDGAKPTGLVLWNYGGIGVLFDVGISASNVGAAAASGDFKITVNSTNVNAADGGSALDASYGNYLRLDVPSDTFTYGVTYTVKVEYTPKSSRPIKYSDGNAAVLTLGKFTIEKTVEAE